jgi:VanZ family protein
VYVAAIFYLGLIPVPRVETGFVPADKVAHLVAFGGMQWLFLRALSFFRARGRFQIAATVGFAAFAGLLLELAQALVPHRSADVWDFVADSLGAVLGGGLSWLLLRRAERARAVATGTEPV